MGGPDIAAKLVEALRRTDGKPDLRPVHAIGISATGYFEASDSRARLLHRRAFSGSPSFGHCPVLERIRLRGCTRRLVGRARNGDAISSHQRPGDGPDRDDADRVLRADPGNFPGLCHSRQTHPGEARVSLPKAPRPAGVEVASTQSLSGRNDQPRRRRDPVCGSKRLRQARGGPGGRNRRAGELSARGISRCPHVHRRCARQDASLGSLQLATRLRRSEHQNYGSGNRPIPAEGSSRSAR